MKKLLISLLILVLPALAEAQLPALNFDGVNDYVAVPNSLSSGSFTIEYWVNTTQTSPAGAQWYEGNGIVDAEVGGVTDDFGTSLLNDKLAFGIGNGDVTIQSSTSINDGSWHHVAVTWDISTGTMNLYIDGYLEQTGTGGAGNSRTAPPRITFGSIQTGIGFFNGSIDEVRLWNVVRTQPEIAANMSCDVAQQAGLVAYYRFNEGIAGGSNTGMTTVDDNSGNWNCGTLNNFALTGGSSNFVTGAISSCNTISTSITGNTTLSTAITTRLADATGGGTWSSVTTSVGTVDPSSGVVTGLSAGTSVISYTLGSGCSDRTTVTVKTLTNGLNFDGSNDYVNCGMQTLNSYTKEAWIYNTIASGSRNIVSGGVTSTDDAFWVTGGHLSAGHNGGWTQVQDAATLSINTWYHVAVTYDAPSTTMKLYKNGVLVNTNSSVPVITTPTGVLLIGAYSLASNCFQGTIDEVRIWNSALPAGTIQANMNCDVPQQSGLVAYYRFDQGTAGGTNTGLTCVDDYSGNNHSGTLNNLALTGSTSNYVTGAAGSCNTITLPSPGSFSGNTPVCVGSNITLSNANTGGTWSTASSNITLNSSSGLVTGVTGGTTAVVNYTLNCNSSSVTVTINAQPAAPTFVSNATACTSTGPQNLGVTAVAGCTVDWYDAASAGLLLLSGNIIYTTSTAGTYYAESSNTTTGCLSTSRTAVILTLYSDPAAPTFIANVTACASAGAQTLSVTAAGGCTVDWYSAASVGSLLSLTSTTYSTSAAGTYYAESRDITSGCLSATRTAVALTVNANPAAPTFIANVTVCPGAGAQNLNVTAAGGSTVDWYDAASGGTLLLSGNATYSISTAGTYYAESRNTTTGCLSTSRTAVVLTVNSNPAVPTFITNVTACASAGAQTLSVTAIGGCTVDWYNHAFGPALMLSGSAAYSTSSAGTYYAESRDITSGCLSTSRTAVVLTVNSNPAVPTFIANVAACASAGAQTLSVTAVGGSTVDWYNAASGPTLLSSGIATYSTSAAGTYYAESRNTTTGCLSTTRTAVVFTVNPNPTIYAVTGGGPYCSGGVGSVIGLANSDAGVNYQLYKGASISGSAVAGTGAAISFGPRNLATTAYHVIATDATTSCTNNMSGTASVSILSSPAIVSMTGGGSVCGGGPGVPVGLSGSAVGISYQLYLGASPVGSPVGGVGFTFNFGTFTTLGTYTCIATNTVNACSSTMSGTAVINAASGITAFAMTGGGSYCAGGTGLNIGLAGTTSGISYQLFLGASAVGSPVTGTGAAIGFGLQTAAGTYTVVGTNTTTGCYGNMTGSVTVTINALPNIWTVTGGGAYCAGGSGLAVGLSLSDVGVNYQLYNGASTVGSPVAGTGAAITFGLLTPAGTYTITATNATTSCSNGMGGSVAVTINPAPTAYAMTGGGSYCAGGTGVLVGLANSASGFTYQLYNGASAVGSPVAGTGAAMSYGLQTTGGTYTVIATNNTTLCTNTMTGSAVVIVNASPAIFSITGGGGYCSGGTGVLIGVSNSQSGVNYQLYNGASAVGSPVAGTGAAISFGLQTTAGTYTVIGTNTTTSCTNTMSGSTTVTIDPLPVAYAVTGGGSYCSGGTGVTVGLANSDGGVNYQLYVGASPAGSPVAGTGTAITFGSQTTAGTYTVVATAVASICSNNMTGSVAVSINALPTAYAVTGGGSYCSGGTGVLVGLANSQSGVNYQLYNGASTVGSPVAGAGAAISFGLQTASGTYTVVATNTTSSCTSNMTGSETITINPLPTVYAVTGGGSFCAGGTGVAVGLANTQSGVNYQLYNGASAVGSPVAGTAAAISFGLQTTAGTYTVVATNASTTCTVNMLGSATVVVNTLPTNYAITGGGSFCSGTGGVAIGLAGSDAGVNYQLYRAGTIAVGSPVAGTGAAISFGSTFTVSGTYTIVATNATTGCVKNITGSTTIIAYTSPASIPVTGGGSYCVGGTGVNVGLSGSALGVNYQLWLGATVIGSSVAGIGSGFNFGLITVAGTYTVTATNTTSGCVSNMTGSATVSVYPALTVYSVTGGGAYCSGGAGMPVGLSGSDVGVNYQLYRGGSPLVSTIVSGTGGALSFGSQTVAGVYTVVATNATSGCTANMSASAIISVNALPTTYSVTGGGSYCTGGTGVLVGLGNSTSGINYQLYRGGSAVGSPVAGTGAAISYGLQTTAGTYTVTATDAISSCSANMSGSASVSINSLPPVYTVSGGGSYCSGPGYHILLNGSNFGINYQLYLGASTVGSPLPGTGGGLDFGAQTSAGTYTVVATNATTSCTSNMTGSGVIVGFSLPTIYAVTGGGNYCSGGTGAAVGLANSDIGINYQLYLGGSITGSPVAGTGSSLNFGLQTVAGTYTVVATNATLGCTSTMSGSAVIAVNPLPAVVSVTGGGSYCSGGTGVAIGIAGSAAGINYQLFNGASPVGSTTAGIGSALSFGSQTAAGTYTVVATNPATGCTSNMSGSATVSINPLPTVYAVTGGGSYCSGGVGVVIGLSNSQTGVNYQLFNGASPVGSPVTGSGIAITFGLKTAAGTYTVVATNASTGCIANMTGSATITINALPAVYAVTGGGAYCSGGPGASVSLANSDAGVNYQLYNGASTVGSLVAGTGASITFGTYTLATTYTVVATNASTGCTNNMSGSASIIVNSLPASVPVTGGGTICIGGTGAAVGLSASATGVNYQLYVGASPAGSPVAGAGTSISFGLQTVAGTYTVIGTNASTGCTNTMSGSATVSNYAPLTTYAVTGTGSYCSGGTGVAVGLAGSISGVNYQLFRGATAIGSPLAGTGAALNFGLQTTAGTYTVAGTNTTTTCTANMTGNAIVSIDPLPTAYALTGGGGYCTGGTGILVGVANSQSGVNYQLYIGASTVGAPIAGTGTAISFGLQAAAGTYTVVATNTTTGCTGNMSGSVSVSINTLPTAYTVSGGGSYCSGPGVHIFLSNSTVGVNYQLFNGVSTVGSAVAGTGASLDFGGFTVVGTYTVTATNATTGCTNNMTGSGVITGASLPTVYAVSGGGNFCSGGTGVVVGVSNSDIGVAYQLYNGAGAVGIPVAGTGVAISFGLQTATGTYTVVGTNTGLSCTSAMSGSATITVTSPPTAYAVTGGGGYCSGGTGVLIGLGNSHSGVNYQLYIGASTVGSPVAGTGAAISFGLQTAAGACTVVATDGTTSCTANMTGSISISINPLPTVYAVTGGGSACAGTAGVLVGLANSQVGVSYQLYNGASTSGSPVAGTGAAVSFGFMTTSGAYTVVATNSTTTCVSNMSGSATVTINPLPTDWAFTGGGTFCAGGSVTIGLINSDLGVNYQLYRTTTALGTVTVGSIIAGTAGAISFGTQTLAGVYTVIATNTTTGCTRTFSGSTTIAILFLPAIMPVTGGGSYCVGGSGVAVTLGGSAVGTNYQLYLSGSPVGSPVAGAGMGISFGLQTTPGTYTVVATNATTGCTSNMSGSATVSTNPLPSVFTVTGGGSYCTGGTGVHIQLSSSTTGVGYKLYNGATPVTGYVTGTGTTIDFGTFTTTGTYTASAINLTTGCANNMTGSATIVILPLPVAGTISGPSSLHDLTTITLTETSAGGVWTSSNPAIATIGSLTGIVTGVSAGYTNIFYTVTNSCGTVFTVFNVHDVGPQPQLQGGVTSGNTSVCIGGTTTLTNTIIGGIWNSGNTDIATINEYSGVINGVAAGIAAITYSTTDGTNTTMVFTPVVVNPAPDKALITAQPGTHIAPGQQLTIKATVANGSPVQSYQWQLNGELIPGATTASYNSSDFADNDVISCNIHGECGDQPLSGSVKISVGNNNVSQVNTSAASIFVLPNPNKGTFTIRGTFANTGDDDALIELVDVLGQVVYKEDVAIKNGGINQLVRPVNDLSNGMYLLTIRTGMENKIFHVVIEK